MTTSNLDIARECFADTRLTSGGKIVIEFSMRALDAFAEHIRADTMAEYAAMTTNGAKAWADVPDATKWVDELRDDGPKDEPSAPARNPIDANDLEAMAKARPDECFLKGTGVLKLTGAIRTLEGELRAAREWDTASIALHLAITAQQGGGT